MDTFNENDYLLRRHYL